MFQSRGRYNEERCHLFVFQGLEMREGEGGCSGEGREIEGEGVQEEKEGVEWIKGGEERGEGRGR